MTGRLLHPDQRPEVYRWAVEHGRLEYTQNARYRCVICGRTGMSGGSWYDACAVNGHTHRCGCGRAFSSQHALSTHHRGGPPNGKPCPWPNVAVVPPQVC